MVKALGEDADLINSVCSATGLENCHTDIECSSSRQRASTAW